MQDEDIFGFAAKASEGIDLSDKVGQFVSLTLVLQDKTVFAFVPEIASTVGMQGFDLFFFSCSEDCAQSLKEALDLERDIYDE
ncbi:MAG: hypothetical protein JSV42_04995 [Chloroflexota bacterium]|nr:MAG: hypothetical protein JSV42_04995 [Chloroflexota bacterium]